MIAGHHLIWTAYGWWLPNDPRGSWSQDIRVERIEELGESHLGRKVTQPHSKEIKDFYSKAADVLKHPLLTFGSEEIALIAEAFAELIKAENYTCYGCAIMPDHVHLAMRRHREHGKVMIEKFQEASRQKLIQTERRALTHPVWGGKGWDRYLNNRGDFERVIEYIRRNPLKIGWEEQVWAFVKPYDGWMPGYRG